MYKLYIDFEDEYLDRISVGETDIDYGVGKYSQFTFIIELYPIGVS